MQLNSSKVQLYEPGQKVQCSEGNMSGNGLLGYLTTSITSMVKNRNLCSMAIRVNVAFM